MNNKAEQKENPDIQPDASDLIDFTGKDILNFSQMEPGSLMKEMGEESLNDITEFIDTEGRPISVKEWGSENFVWLRAYDNDKARVPETPNPGQAGLANLMIETKNPSDTKLRLGDIIIPDNYRGAGIAKKMLDRSVSIGKEMGVSQIYGAIEDDKARGFWEHMQKYGWKIDPDKGAYGQVSFSISQADKLEKESPPAILQSDNNEAAYPPRIPEVQAEELKEQTMGLGMEQKQESPLLTDKMKKVVVGISILATLVSGSRAFDEYQKNHLPTPENTNEIVLNESHPESAIGALLEKSTAEYHLTENPVINTAPTLVPEKAATPATEIQEAAKQEVDINEKPENATIWYKVPEYRQPDGISCTPTSVSMVLGYWNSVDSKYSTRTAKELYKENIDEGKVSSAGMVIVDLDDELTALNYNSKTTSDGNRSGLEAALAQGPVVALVKYSNGELSPRGVGHAVVVSGMTGDDQVRVTDPMHGSSRLYKWAQFDAAWGANWNTNATRYFTSIKPSELAL